MAGSSVTVADLLKARAIHAGEPIVMRRRSGPPREATVQADGTIRLASGCVGRLPKQRRKQRTWDRPMGGSSGGCLVSATRHSPTSALISRRRRAFATLCVYNR